MKWLILTQRLLSLSHSPRPFGAPLSQRPTNLSSDLPAAVNHPLLLWEKALRCLTPSLKEFVKVFLPNTPSVFPKRSNKIKMSSCHYNSPKAMDFLYALHSSGKGRHRNIHNRLPYPHGRESPDGEALCLAQSGNPSAPSWGVTLTSGGQSMVQAGGAQLGEGSLAESCGTGRTRFD